MNQYEKKIESKKMRYAAMSEKAKSDGLTAYSTARTMAAAIPFGQPIHIGHHSEGADRRYRAKIHQTFGRAFGLMEKAEHYQRKAEIVGTGGISSDDPAALIKLREKLAQQEAAHEKMKAANVVIRKNAGRPDAQIEALISLGFKNSQAVDLINPNQFGGAGFASFSLSNSNARINSTKARIAVLERARTRESKEIEDAFYTYREDTNENRIMFIFDGKPNEATRAILKRFSFKWSPSRGAWVRQITSNALWAAQEVRKALRLVV